MQSPTRNCYPRVPVKVLPFTEILPVLCFLVRSVIWHIFINKTGTVAFQVQPKTHLQFLNVMPKIK